MIQFFRKIRQRLLSEEKLSKYLIYAVAEIILVVILGDIEMMTKE